MTMEQLALMDGKFLKGWDIYNEEVSKIHDADWFKAALYHGRRVGIYRPMDSIEPALQRAHQRIALESPLLAARFAVSIHYGHWPTRLESFEDAETVSAFQTHLLSRKRNVPRNNKTL